MVWKMVSMIGVKDLVIMDKNGSLLVKVRGYWLCSDSFGSRPSASNVNPQHIKHSYYRVLPLGKLLLENYVSEWIGLVSAALNSSAGFGAYQLLPLVALT